MGWVAHAALVACTGITGNSSLYYLHCIATGAGDNRRVFAVCMVWRSRYASEVLPEAENFSKGTGQQPQRGLGMLSAKDFEEAMPLRFVPVLRCPVLSMTELFATHFSRV